MTDSTERAQALPRTDGPDRLRMETLRKQTESALNRSNSDTKSLATVKDAVPKPQGTKAKLIYWLWDPDDHLKSPEERKLVRKLDLGILIVTTIGWLMKYIDQTNLANAYVSGMKQDLNILANEYTYMNTAYNVAYAVMQIPSNLIVLHVRPSIWLAICEIFWGIFTIAQGAAQNSKQMYIFRALVGFWEAAFAPVVIFLLGSWYTPQELGKRMAIWYIAGPLGQATSGYLQAAIHKSLDQHYGIAGWRWLYIVCGCVTLPCGIALFIFLPDYPANARVFYLSQSEIELARSRCDRAGTVLMTGQVDMRLLKRVLSAWRFWVIVPLFVIFAMSLQSANYFGIWLLYSDYSVSARNIFPAGTSLISIPCTLLYAYLSDRFNTRYWLCVLPYLYGIIPISILVHWHVPNNVKLFAFLTSYVMLASSTFYTWVNEICKDSAEERAIIIAAMSTAFFAFNAWVPIFTFPQLEAPDFPHGFSFCLACTAASILGLTLMNWLHGRQLDQQRIERDSGRGLEPAVRPEPIVEFSGTSPRVDLLGC